MTSTTASLSVGEDASTVFIAFTEEWTCGGFSGPLNYFDVAPAIEVGLEPGVGGRIVEVYDEVIGEGLEEARITVLEPSSRRAWKSSVDDVI